MTRPLSLCLILSLVSSLAPFDEALDFRQPAFGQTFDDGDPGVVEPTAPPALPWPDAAPAPPALPEEFARRVMKPVVLALPGMDAVEYTRNLRYTEVDSTNLLLDVYRPAGVPRETGLPAVLFIHGGTDTRAQPKDWGVFQSWGRLAAASGLVGVTFTHRLGFPETRVREGAADVAAALDSGYPLTLTNHPDGPHGFDNEVDDARSREIVLETLEFLKRHLLGSDVHSRTAADGATESEPAPRLAVFAPFLNKTWKALVDPEAQVHDVARWEPALGGQAIRMLHSVGDGAYGGETLVTWDRDQEELVYYYFTTVGFYTSGTMSFDDDGRLHSRERVTGNEAGVTEVHATTEILPDGRMKVRTRMLRDGEWEDRGAVIYTEDPAAEVILN